MSGTAGRRRRPRANAHAHRREPASSPFPPIADYALPVRLPHRRAAWRRTARSSGCARRASTRRASSARCSTAAPAASASAPTACCVPGARRYEPGTNIVETTWMTPSGWLVVRDALTIGPWSRAATRPSTRARRPTPTPTACSCGRSSASRAACRSRWSASRCSTTARMPRAVGAGRRWLRRRRRDRRQVTTLRLTSDMRIGIEGNRARARHTLEEGETRFCALSWASGAARAARASRRRARCSTAPRTSGAAGSTTATSPTTAGASTCSARRSC